MVSSSRNRQKKSYIEYGVSYVKIYKKKSCDDDDDDDDEGSADDDHHHHQEDVHFTSVVDLTNTIEEEEEQSPPYVIVVHGPPKVGKTLLIKCLVDLYTDGSHSDMAGPIRVVAGDKRRIQFVECPNNVNGMIDAAKYADAVIFVIDAGYGFEMETFEFLQLLKVHGMPKVMGVLTYLDTFKNEDLKVHTRQRLLDQFRTEICKAAQLFCLSGLDNTTYFKHEISMLAAYISTMEFHPLSWRAARPYMLVDYLEDVTSHETVQMDEECSRKIILKGYLRGCDGEDITKVHIAGFGDFPLASVTSLIDPFPLPPGDGYLDEVVRTEIEGFRAGTYVRLEVCDVPSVMVKNYDPGQPTLVGGITTEKEQDVGHIQVKLERHNWNLKLLKSKDPIIVSVGWRRYQTTPIFAGKDLHGKYWLLNRTPKNSHCYALFIGPHAPPETGIAIVQSLADGKAAFRFLAKGCVVGVNQAPQIYKKSKRIGTPCKISRKTAFVKGLFTTDLEIAKFKGAKIQTASGVYGKIIKPAGEDFIGLENTDSQPREGIANCTFKRRIRNCDTIFMHVCEKVKVPCFFNPIMRGPEPPDRIWESKVDTCRGGHLKVAADFESFYKTHINPSEPKDHELRSKWITVMLAQGRATTKEEKKAVQLQKEELKVATEERRRERKVLPRRRQTLEQLRGVCFIESQKKQKETNVLITEELRKNLFTGFIDYEKDKQRMTNLVLAA